MKHKPPVLLVHGDADPLIPSMALFAATRVLGDAGFQVDVIPNDWPGRGYCIVFSKPPASH